MHLLSAYPDAESVVMHPDGKFSKHVIATVDPVDAEAESNVISLSDEDDCDEDYDEDDDCDGDGGAARKRRRRRSPERIDLTTGPFFQPREVIVIDD